MVALKEEACCIVGLKAKFGKFEEESCCEWSSKAYKNCQVEHILFVEPDKSLAQVYCRQDLRKTELEVDRFLLAAATSGLGAT